MISHVIKLIVIIYHKNNNNCEKFLLLNSLGVLLQVVYCDILSDRKCLFLITFIDKYLHY